MLHSFTPACVFAALLHVLPVRCFPFDNLARRNDAPPNRPITQTVVSTVLTTSTMTTYTTLAPSPVASSPAPVPAVSPQAADVPSSPAVASSPGATPAIDHTPSPLSTTVYTTTVVPTQDTPPPSPVSPMPLPSSPTSDSPSPPIATPPVSSNKQGSPPSRPEVMAYYPDWVTADFPPEKIDFNRLDWIDYAFAVPDASYNVQWDGADDGGQFLTRLVNAAHAAGKKVKVSIGGWTGSRYFSPATSSDTTRKQLATNILNLYRQYNLDGVDIDWEYPAQQGDSANAVSPSDTANYLLFLQLLRKTLPPQAKITAAAMTVPWAGPDGQPLKDMREFAQVLDWVLLMNYDTWGSSLKPGPNSPLNDACHNSTQPSASAVSSIQMWTQAGFPARQIVLGVPSYGYISKSSATRLRTRRDVGVLQDPRALSGSGRRLRRDAAAAASSGLGLGLGWGVLNPLVAGALVDALVPDLVAAEEKEKEKQPQPPGRPASSGSGSDADSGDGSADSSPSSSDESGNSGDSSSDDSTGDDTDSGSDDDNADDSGSGDVKSEAYENGVIFATNDDGGTENGQVQFASLLRQGILQYALPSPSSPSSQQTQTQTFASRTIPNAFAAIGGFTRHWDACSNTPFLTSSAAKQVVTYDDAQSVEMKGMVAREAGVRGVNVFDVHGDSDHWDLVDALRRGLGVDPPQAQS